MVQSFTKFEVTMYKHAFINAVYHPISIKKNGIEFTEDGYIYIKDRNENIKDAVICIPNIDEELDLEQTKSLMENIFNSNIGIIHTSNDKIIKE